VLLVLNPIVCELVLSELLSLETDVVESLETDVVVFATCVLLLLLDELDDSEADVVDSVLWLLTELSDVLRELLELAEVLGLLLLLELSLLELDELALDELDELELDELSELDELDELDELERSPTPLSASHVAAPVAWLVLTQNWPAELIHMAPVRNGLPSAAVSTASLLEPGFSAVVA